MPEASSPGDPALFARVQVSNFVAQSQPRWHNGRTCAAVVRLLAQRARCSRTREQRAWAPPSSTTSCTLIPLAEMDTVTYPFPDADFVQAASPRSHLQVRRRSKVCTVQLEPERALVLCQPEGSWPSGP